METGDLTQEQKQVSAGCGIKVTSFVL